MSENYYDLGKMVIYKNNQFIAFNKPPGLAIQSKEKPDLHEMANAYAKRKLFLLHRIDQPASGVVLFARNKKSASAVGGQFKEGTVERCYLAIVKNKPSLQEAVLKDHLTIDHKHNKTYIAGDLKKSTRAKLSELAFNFVGSSDLYHLLRVQLHTGRHHQIRAQLANMGSPIKGDVKYGDRRSNKDRSIHLHAHRIRFLHPVTGLPITVEASVPEDTLWKFFGDMI